MPVMSRNYMDNSPAFVLAIVDLTKNNNVIKNNTFFEEYRHIFGACVPKGENTEKNKFILANGTETYYHCNDNDYKYFMAVIIRVLYRVENVDIIPIEITRNENSNISFTYLIPFFILLIPIFIYIFILIYKMCRRNRKDNNNIGKNEIKNENERKSYNNHLTLNDYFNLNANLEELFNYDESKDKGILYIKGIVGVSILFTILGQLFLIFSNLFMKDFGRYQFYKLLSSYSYVLIYIGLRYSPRVLFSCSGFTLTYKSLKFNEKEPKYSLFKFFFLQFYKYLILILFVFFLRYSLYEIISLLEIRPIWKALDKLELKQPTDSKILLLKILNLSSFWDIKKLFSLDDDSKFSHDLFDYLWMPFNN
jgi:hypothetical protein